MKQMVLRILQVSMPLKSQHFEEKERKKAQSALRSASMHLEENYFEVMHTFTFDREDFLNTRAACKH